jgi:hypothetical protein
MVEATQRHERGPAGFVVAIIVNALLLLAWSAHGVWRPWLGGVVTPSFEDVLWAFYLGCSVQILGNVLLLANDARWLRRTVDTVTAAASLVGVIAFYRVFPLDLSRFGDWATVTARVVLMLGVIGSGVATLVGLIRLVLGGEVPPAPRPSHP